MTSSPRVTRRRLLLAGVGLTALAGCGWATQAYRRDVRAAKGALVGASRMIDTRVGPIELGEVGLGAPLLVLHGTGGGFDMGLAMARPLLRAGWRVLAPSRFGYLRTPMPDDASEEAQADSLAALLDALQIERLPVIGGSAGAISALWFAVRHPQRCSALVALVPATHVPDRPETPAAAPWAVPITERLLRSDALFWAASRLAPSALTGALLGTDPDLVAAASAAEQARVRAVLHGLLPLSARAEGLLNDARQSRHPRPLPLDQLQLPLLAIACEDDGFGTHAAARHLAETVEDAELLSFARGGHLWVGHDDAVFERIDRFLRGARSK